jgi:hypothetical protein
MLRQLFVCRSDLGWRNVPRRDFKISAANAIEERNRFSSGVGKRAGVCKEIRSGREQPDQNAGELQNLRRNFNVLAQNSLGYRYTIPHLRQQRRGPDQGRREVLADPNDGNGC